MNELKPEDVMRALEYWVRNFDGQITDYVVLCRALALLREKDAEIERLKAEVAQVRTELNHATNLGCEAYETARADAITEFAERLKACFDTYPDNEEAHALYVRSLVDQIAKEMKGETDGKTDL